MYAIRLYRAHEYVNLRYVCGQTINLTAMIYTCLESPTYLDVQTGKRFALCDRNRRIWRLRSRHKNNYISLSRPNCVLSNYISIYCVPLHFVGTRRITYAWATQSSFISWQFISLKRYPDISHGDHTGGVGCVWKSWLGSVRRSLGSTWMI